MRRFFGTLFLLGLLATAFASDPVTGRVLKVLPLFLDARGRDAVSPSLFDRDAYQVYLREHTNEISAMRFDVLWKAAHAGEARLKLRLELRSVSTNSLPRQTTLEQSVTPGHFSRWTALTLDGADYRNFGELVAWHATLWSEDHLLAEQKSFLW
jgi:hypothetical protein